MSVNCVVHWQLLVNCICLLLDICTFTLVLAIYLLSIPLPVGDAPIAVARYRISNGSDGVSCIEIDRAGILPAYRGQKFSKLVITDILSDTRNYLKGSPYVIVLSVPVGSWAVAKLESQGWRIKYEEMEQRGPKSFLRMTFAAGPSWPHSIPLKNSILSLLCVLYACMHNLIISWYIHWHSLTLMMSKMRSCDRQRLVKNICYFLSNWFNIMSMKQTIRVPATCKSWNT